MNKMLRSGISFCFVLFFVLVLLMIRVAANACFFDRSSLPVGEWCILFHFIIMVHNGYEQLV